MLHWLDHVLGLDDGTGHWYLFWSGIGANFGEFAIVGALVATYRRHTCHVDSPHFCWRPGVHPVRDSGFRTCGRHHPTVPDSITAEHIADVHRGDT
jgi:hypothetical protein